MENYISPSTTSPALAVSIILSCAVATWTVYCLLLSPLRDFPGPLLARVSPLWIVLQCRRGRRSQAVSDLHEQYGDFVRIAPNHISIANPAAVQQLYGHQSGFLKGPFYQDIILPFHQVEPVLFNTRSPQVHQRKKKMVSPAFSAKSLQEFEPYMTKNMQKLIKSIHEQLQTSERITLDFNVYANFLAFDVIGSFAFGESFGFLDREEDYLNLIEAVDARGEVLNALGHIPPSLIPLVKRLPLDPFWSQGLRGTQALAAIGTKAYFNRRDQVKSRKDLLSFLFTAKDPETGEALGEKEIIAESISFIVGGSDTTSTSMVNVVDIVSRSEQIQRRLQEELDDAFPGEMPEDWVADFRTVESLPVLIAIVRETMRFRPTSATGLERVTPKGGKVVAGRLLPEGTLVSVPTFNIHHNPTAFKDPEQFRYERWLDDGASKLLESFVPFSIGPRACIGRNFAWMEILNTLATMFKLYHLERVSVGETMLREGFFVKTRECEIALRRRVPRA
ncbi:cytochrome P450 [Aspergillus pseudonomiae]|nr:cytochrome P450 [Aspergillus pseudonomiae]